MTRFFAVALALVLSACGQGAPVAHESSATAEQAAIAPASTAAGESIGSDEVNACFLSAEQVSAALGSGYRAGVSDNRNAPYLQSCEYSGGAYDVLVQAYWTEPGMPQAPLSGTLSGNTEPVTGDADGAIFDPPVTSGGCAIAYRRSNVTYTITIMNCRGFAEARDRLAGLPRP